MRKILALLLLVGSMAMVVFGPRIVYKFCNGYYEPEPETTKKFFSEFWKNDAGFLLLLDKWEQKTADLPVTFSAEKVKENLAKIHNSQSTRGDIVDALNQNWVVAFDFRSILEGTELYEGFDKDIYKPLLKMRELYYSNRYLYKEEKFSNEMKDMSKLIAYVDKFIIKVERDIIVFACEYNGYFDEPGFIKLIGQIRNARNYDEFHEKLTWLKEATDYCCSAYIGEYTVEWAIISANVNEALEKVEKANKF